MLFRPSLWRCMTMASFMMVATGTIGIAESGYAQTSSDHPVNMLPSPPLTGSAGAHYDDEVYKKDQKLRDTPRWKLAAEDAKLDVASILHNYSCAAGFALTPETAPATARLVEFIRKNTYDLTQFEKQHWHHPRPLNVYPDNPICTEDKRESLSKSPSYPSGHTTLLWSVALTLAEALPAQAPAVAERGMLMGDSRKVCGVHWASDVNAGYLTASYLVSQFHTVPEYRTLVTQAHAELQHLKQTAPAIDATPACVSEKHFIETLTTD